MKRIFLGAFLGVLLTFTMISSPVNTSEPIIVDQPVHHVKYVNVPVPVVINQTRVIKEHVYVDRPIIINHTIIKPVYQNLTDFPSKAKLLTFIWCDSTNEIEYSDRWTCMDYSLRVIENAAKQGYHVHFLFEWRDADTTHALCMTYVTQEAQYVIWDPQTDIIEWEWTSTRGG